MPEIQYLRDKVNAMSPSEKGFVAFAINQFGDGQHPVADKENLGMFAADYAKSCVKEYMISDGKTGKGLEIATLAIKSLGGY